MSRDWPTAHAIWEEDEIPESNLVSWHHRGCLALGGERLRRKPIGGVRSRGRPRGTLRPRHRYYRPHIEQIKAIPTYEDGSFQNKQDWWFSIDAAHGRSG